MKQLHIEGYPCNIFSVPDPEGELFEVSAKLIDGHLRLLADLPDSAKVVLTEESIEQYTPPRCRKPRERLVSRPIMEWTLGEFRVKSAGP